MNVFLVVQSDYPHVGEVRPRKLARSLHRAGHRVCFLSGNSRQRSTTEHLGYAKVYRFSYFLRSRFYSWLGAPFPVNLFWAFWILSTARKERPDVFIASNIRVALPTILAARLLRKPVVLDLEENNAEAVKLYPKTRLVHYLMRNSLLVGALESLCAILSDHVWVVVDERLEYLPRSLCARGKASVVCHTPGLEELPADRAKSSDADKPFTLIYIGLFTAGVGSVELVMRALRQVVGRDKNVRFVIGGGRQLESLARELGIQDHVIFAGVIEPQKVVSWLQQGDVGVIAYEVNQFTNSTVSNKLFHYMAAGLPVLCTAMVPTQRILDEVRCGVTIPERSTERDVADLVLRLKNSPNERAAMGERGKQAIREKYNWECDFRHALGDLEKLVSRNGGRVARGG